MANNKTNSFEGDILKLIFNGTAIASLAQNHASPATELFVALFTADPTEAGSFTNEANYTGYARKGVPRLSNGTTGWAVTVGTETTAIGGASGAVATNEGNIQFGACTAGTNTITHAGICKSLSGTGTSELIIAGALTTSLAVSNGVTPQFAAGTISFTEL